MTINVRPLVKELLENKDLIVSYVELDNGGFDLSVRIDEEEANRAYLPRDNELDNKIEEWKRNDK